jgi:hypothetical protein
MAFEGWTAGVPPTVWERTLAMDVGGSSPNAVLVAALDPAGYIVIYDEVYKISTNMREIADLTLPKLKSPEGDDLKFRFKIGDYANRIALADMGRCGITFDNAIKVNKLLSVHRLSGYLHPNVKRPFPSWHPNAGRPGSPLLFITPKCSNLIKELPQQRWKEGMGDSLKDELDRTIPNHAVDCLLYTLRMLPPPQDVLVTTCPVVTVKVNQQSAAYWADFKRRKEKTDGNQNRPRYNPSHVLGGVK